MAAQPRPASASRTRWAKNVFQNALVLGRQHDHASARSGMRTSGVQPQFGLLNSAASLPLTYMQFIDGQRLRRAAPPARRQRQLPGGRRVARRRLASCWRWKITLGLPPSLDRRRSDAGLPIWPKAARPSGDDWRGLRVRRAEGGRWGRAWPPAGGLRAGVRELGRARRGSPGDPTLTAPARPASRLRRPPPRRRCRTRIRDLSARIGEEVRGFRRAT